MIKFFNLGAAVLAAALLFASCDKDPKDPPVGTQNNSNPTEQKNPTGTPDNPSNPADPNTPQTIVLTASPTSLTLDLVDDSHSTATITVSSNVEGVEITYAIQKTEGEGEMLSITKTADDSYTVNAVDVEGKATITFTATKDGYTTTSATVNVTIVDSYVDAGEAFAAGIENVPFFREKNGGYYGFLLENGSIYYRNRVDSDEDAADLKTKTNKTDIDLPVGSVLKQKIAEYTDITHASTTGGSINGWAYWPNFSIEGNAIKLIDEDMNETFYPSSHFKGISIKTPFIEVTFGAAPAEYKEK